VIRDAINRLMPASVTPIRSAADPFDVLAEWLDDAKARGNYAEPSAMSLATATPDGRPSVRVVLCKSIDREADALTFYTNYESRKGRELTANPRAATVFYWPHAERQARVEGMVERLSEHESDEYFASRPLLSRVGAVVSPQSRVIASRAELLTAAARVAGSAAAGAVARPAHWGGYRLVATEVELWSGCPGRLHQRVRWRRGDAGSGTWTRELLAP
jgi:pyridoxamine 5'-phosphate oxidase